MIRIFDLYTKTAMPHVYREGLWLVCFGESPHGDPLEALLDDEPPAPCRMRCQHGGNLKIISSDQEVVVPSIRNDDQQKTI